MANDIGGVWRTIGGRRVFIKDGQSLADAMKASGKFKNGKEVEHEINKDTFSRFSKEYEKDKKKHTIDKNDINALNELADSGKDINDYYGLDDIAKDYIKNRRQEIGRNEFTKKADEIHKKTLDEKTKNLEDGKEIHDVFRQMDAKEMEAFARQNPESIKKMQDYLKENQKSDLMTAEQLKGKDREEQKEINKQYLKEQNKLAQEKNKEDNLLDKVYQHYTPQIDDYTVSEISLAFNDINDSHAFGVDRAVDKLLEHGEVVKVNAGNNGTNRVEVEVNNGQGKIIFTDDGASLIGKLGAKQLSVYDEAIKEYENNRKSDVSFNFNNNRFEPNIPKNADKLVPIDPHKPTDEAKKILGLDSKKQKDDNQFTMYNSQYDKEVTVKKGADGKWVDSDGNKYMGYLSKQDVKQYFKGNWKESTEKRTASEIISSQMSKTRNAKIEVANALGLKYDNDNRWKSTSQLYKEQKGKDIANIAIDSGKADKYNAFVKKNYNREDKNFSDRVYIDKYAKDNNLDADALYYMTKIASESDRTKLKKKAFELYKKQHPNTKKTIYSFEDDIK